MTLTVLATTLAEAVAKDEAVGRYDLSAGRFGPNVSARLRELAATQAPVDLARFARVFEAWENGYRADPSTFLTAEECAAQNVSVLSADRAAYFCELLGRV